MKLFLSVLFSCLLHLASAQLTIQNGTYWKVSGNTYTVLQNVSLVNNGNLVMDDGSFKFTGSNNTVISGNQSTTFTDIILEKNAVNKVMLQRNINIENRLTFVSGLFDLNNFDIALSKNGLLIGENESSRVIGTNGGNIKISDFLTAPVAVNPGNLGAIITSTQNLGSIEIRRSHQSQATAGGPNSVLRRYDISPTNNSNLNATLRFNYFDAELNGLTESNLVLWRSPDLTNWSNENFTSRSVSTNYVEKTGIPSFSAWILSNSGNALPVTGLHLSGRWKNNVSELNWTTFTEYSNSHFEIERKYSTENDFTVTGRKYSAHIDGNSQLPTAYQNTDATAVANHGNIFYRLKQVDRDGKFIYSNIISINPTAAKRFIEKLYPTVAVQQSIYVQVGNANLSNMQVSLYDMNGKLYFTKKLNYSSQWIALPTLANGIYRMQFEGAEWKQQLSFVKQ